MSGDLVNGVVSGKDKGVVTNVSHKVKGKSFCPSSKTVELLLT